MVHQIPVKHISIFEINILTIQPIVHVLKNIFQILDAISTGFECIITQIVREGSRIKRCQQALPFAIAENRISGFLCNPFFDNFIISFLCRGFRIRLISYLHGIVVGRSNFTLNEYHIFIFRLCHVVISQFVHNRRADSVLLGERSRTQGICRVSIGGGSVAQEPQHCSRIVGNHGL